MLINWPKQASNDVKNLIHNTNEYKFHLKTLREFSKAVMYFSERSLPLGLAFYSEVENALVMLPKILPQSFAVRRMKIFSEVD